MKKEGQVDFNVIICTEDNSVDYDILKDKCNKILSRKLSDPEVNIKLLTRERSPLVEKYSKDIGLPLQIIQADWKVQGKLAGVKRNNRLIELGNACILFSNSSNSKSGLDDLRKKAEKSRLLVREIKL